MRDTFKKYFALPQNLKCWIVAAFLSTALVKLLLLILPTAALLKWVNKRSFNKDKLLTPAQIDFALSLGGVVSQVANHTPWQSQCLVQSLSTVLLLHMKGIPAQLKVGARKADGQLQAHAWVTVAGQTVNGVVLEDNDDSIVDNHNAFVELLSTPARYIAPGHHVHR